MSKLQIVIITIAMHPFSTPLQALERIFVALAAVNNPTANLDLACIMSKL